MSEKIKHNMKFGLRLAKKIMYRLRKNFSVPCRFVTDKRSLKFLENLFFSEIRLNSETPVNA